MSGFTIRCNGDKVFQEQLRQLTVRLNTPLSILVRQALSEVYSEDLKALRESASFVADGGHSKHHFIIETPEAEVA